MAGGDAGPEVLAAYEERPGAPRARRRLRLARLDGARAARPRHRRGPAAAAARGLLGRRADARLAGPLARVAPRRAAAGRAHEPPRPRRGGVAGAHHRATSAPPIIFVSHDRWFLESVATGVLELERGRGKLWPMRYSAFRRERALAIDRQGAEAERQAAEIARLERFVTRWSAGTKARQAASRKKRLDRIERIEAPRKASAPGVRLPQGRAQRPGGDRGRRPRRRGARAHARRGRRLHPGARSAPGGRRPQRRRQDDPDRDADRQPPAGPRARQRRPPGGARLLLAARARSWTRSRTVSRPCWPGATSPRPRRAPCSAASSSPGEAAENRVERLSGGERRRLSLVALIARGRQPAGPRRAHQPPGHREPRGAGGARSRPSTARS